MENKKEERVISYGPALFRNFMFLAFAFMLLAPSVSADSTIGGGYFTPGATFYVYAYDASGHACEGAGAGANYITEDWFDAPGTWSLTIPSAKTGATVYFSLCTGALGTIDTTYSQYIADSTAYAANLSRVVTGADLHANFTGATKWLICTSIGGTKLNEYSSNFGSSTSNAFFFMNSTVFANYYAFEKDTEASCAVDTTVQTGRLVNVTKASDLYGVNVPFSPDTKVVGTIHTDFNSRQLWVQDASANLGFTGSIIAGNYILYYDNSGAGNATTVYSWTNGSFPNIAEYSEKMTGYTTSTFTDTVNEMTYKINGTVPNEVATVETTIGSITYSVPTNASSPKQFALYVPASTPTVVFKNSAGSILFSYTYGTAIGADQFLSVANFSGTVHSNLDGGTIQFYQNNDCTINASIQSTLVTPSGGSYTAYLAYVNGSAAAADTFTDFFPLINDTSQYVTCGNDTGPVGADATKSISYNRMVNGTTPSSLTAGGVALDLNGDVAFNSGNDSYTNISSSGAYRLYVPSQAAAHAVMVFSDAVFTALELNRSKTVSADTPFDVAEVNWTTAKVHADLSGVPYTLEVNEYNASTNLSSEFRTLGGNDAQYYEVPTIGLVDFVVSGAAPFYVNNFTATAGNSTTYEPNTKVDINATSDISAWEITNGSKYNYRADSNSNPIYVDWTENSTTNTYVYSAYYLNQSTLTTLAISKTGKNATTNSDWLINIVRGVRLNLHNDIRSGGTWNVSVSEIGVGTASSEPVNMYFSGSLGNYVQFYEDNATNNFVIDIQDENGAVMYYIYNYDPGAGGAKTFLYEPNASLNITAPSGVTGIQVVNNDSGLTYRDGTLPFQIYLNSTPDYNISAYNVSFTNVVLNRSDKILTSGGYNWTIGLINGTCNNIHANLRTATHSTNQTIRVVNSYVDPATWTTYSSNNVNLTQCNDSIYELYYDQADVLVAGNADIVITNGTNVSFAIDGYIPTGTPDVMTLEPRYNLTINHPATINPSATFTLPAGTLGTNTGAVSIVVNNDSATKLVPVTAIYLPAANNYTFSLYSLPDFGGSNVLKRTGKNISAAHTWNVTVVTGATANIHGDLVNAIYWAFVYDYNDTNIVSGRYDGTQNATFAANYELYYDKDDSGTGAMIRLVNSSNSNEVLTRFNYTGAEHKGAGNVAFEPDALIDAVYPATLQSFLYYNSTSISYLIAASEHSGDTFVDSNYTPFRYSAFNDTSWSTEVLRRLSKNVTVNTTWNIAMLSGNPSNIHTNLVGVSYRVYVHNSTDLGNVSGIEGGAEYAVIPAVGTNYTLYYDVDDVNGTVMAVHVTNGAASLLSRYWMPKGAGAGSDAFEPNALVTPAAPGGIQSYAYIQAGGNCSLNSSATENSGACYMPNATYVFDAFSDDAWTTQELTRAGKAVAAGANTWNIADFYWTAGDISIDLNDTDYQLIVSNGSQTENMSSEKRVFSVSDVQYYEVPSSNRVDLMVFNNSSTGWLFYVDNYTTAAADNRTFEPAYKVLPTMSLNVSYWTINSTQVFPTYRAFNSSSSIYVDNGTADVSGDYTYNAYTTTDLVLTRSGKNPVGNNTFNVSTVHSTYVHGDLSGMTDPLVIYTAAGTTASCTGALSSTTTVPMTADNLKFYERVDAGNVQIQVTNGSYVTCINTLTAAVAIAPYLNEYNFSTKTNGTLPQNITNVYVDADSDDANDISTTVMAGTPKTYAIYWNGSASADISYYNATTVQLNISTRDLSSNILVNVGVINGTSHTNMTVAQVYNSSSCNVLLSTETDGQPFSGIYYRYFEDNGTSQFLGASNGTYTSCGINGFNLTNQEANINMSRMVSGYVPSDTVSALDTDVNSVGANIDGVAGDDYQAVIPTSAAHRLYVLFVDSNVAGASSNLSFYTSGSLPATTTMVLNKVKDMSANLVFSAAKLYNDASGQNTHANISRIDVCNDYPVSPDGDCTTFYSNSTGATPAASKFDAFFEQPTNETAYYAKVNDTDAYVSYVNFTADYFGESMLYALDGLLHGTIYEAYDGATTIANVTITMSPTTANTPFRGRTYSIANGTYRFYSNTTGNNYRAKYAKAGYITNNTDALALSASLLNNVNLVSGIVVTVTDPGLNPINDATVSIYNCTSNVPSTCTVLIANCTNPAGNCTRTASNTAAGEYYFSGVADGTYVQARITRAPYDTYYDPTLNASVNTHQVSTATVVTMNASIFNAAPSCTVTATGSTDTATISGTLYAKNVTGIVTFTADCSGELGLNVTGNLSAINGNASQAFYSQGSGIYNYVATVGSIASGTKSIPVATSDGQNSVVNTATIVVDGDAPSVTSTSPGTAQNTRSVIIYATTDATATCRYSTTDQAYSAMTNVMSGADTVHQAMVWATNGATNTYYIRCSDSLNNAMAASNNSTFEVDAVAPSITNATPIYNATPYNSSNLGAIQVTADMNATCKWSYTEQSYAAMASAVTPVNASNMTALTGATAAQGLNNIYVRCISNGSSAIEMSSSALITFNYDSAAPTYELVSISSSGGMSSGGIVYAKSGDAITLRFTPSENITGTPTVTIGGQAMDRLNYTGGMFTYNRTLDGTEAVGAEIYIIGGTDSAGNAATAYNDSGASAQFDFIAPVLSSPLPTTIRNSKSFSVSVIGDATGLTCKYSMFNATFANMEGSLADIGNTTYQATAVVLADGSYTVYFACRDLAGNINTNTTGAFNVNSTAPTVTASAPQGGYSTATPVTINVTTDVAANCNYDVQDRSYATMAYGFDTGNGTTAHSSSVALSEGLNNIYVACADLNGNAMSSSVLLYVTLDTAAPTYELVSISSSGGMSSGAVVYAKSADVMTLRFSGSEPITGWPTVTIGGQAMANVSYLGGTFTYTRTLNESETATAIISITGGTDAAGNAAVAYGDAGANAQFDFTAPTLTVPLPTTTQNTRSFLASVNGGEAGLTCKVDYATATFGSMAYSMSDLANNSYQNTLVVPSDGSYTAYFACRDLAGNINTTNTGAFTVNSTAPTITNTTPAYSATPYTAGNLGSIQVKTDTAAQCRWAPSDASFANMPVANEFNTTANTLATLTGATASQGLNLFYVRCTGTVEMGSSSLVSFNYDTIAPNVYEWGYVINRTARTVNVWILSSEALKQSTLMMTFNGSNMTYMFGNGSIYRFNFTYASGWSGAYNVTVSACTDEAGNACLLEPAYFPFAITIDEAAPTASLVYNSTAWMLTAGTDEDAVCKYSIGTDAAYDDMPYAMTGDEINHSAMVRPVESATAYQVYVRCEDGYGNNMSTSANVSIAVDTVAPSITGSYPSGVISNSTPTLYINTSENARCQYSAAAFAWGSGTNLTNTTGTTHSAALGTLTDATYTYYVLCRDTAGNTMATALPVTFVVDSTGNFNYTYTLNLGWNSFWLPRIILQNFSSFNDSNYSVVNVLDTKGGITSNYDYLRYRNGSSCSYQNGSCWQSYDPLNGSVNDLTVFNDWDNLPYWIHMNASDRLELN